MKKIVSRLGFQPGTNIALAIIAVSPFNAPPPLSVTILFIYHTIKKTIQKTRLYYTGQLRTIRETRLYKFICVAYIQSLWVANAPNGKPPMNENLDLSY